MVILIPLLVYLAPAQTPANYEGNTLLNLLGKDVLISPEGRELTDKYQYKSDFMGQYYGGTINGLTFDAPNDTIDYIKLVILSEKQTYHGKLPFGLNWNKSVDAVNNHLKNLPGVHDIESGKGSSKDFIQWKTTHDKKLLKVDFSRHHRSQYGDIKVRSLSIWLLEDRSPANDNSAKNNQKLQEERRLAKEERKIRQQEEKERRLAEMSRIQEEQEKIAEQSRVEIQQRQKVRNNLKSIDPQLFLDMLGKNWHDSPEVRNLKAKTGEEWMNTKGKTEEYFTPAEFEYPKIAVSKNNPGQIVSVIFGREYPGAWPFGLHGNMTFSMMKQKIHEQSGIVDLYVGGDFLISFKYPVSGGFYFADLLAGTDGNHTLKIRWFEGSISDHFAVSDNKATSSNSYNLYDDDFKKHSDAERIFYHPDLMECQGDCYNGKGKVTFTVGPFKRATYDGDWKNQLVDGKGTLSYRNPGDNRMIELKGTFKNGRLDNGILIRDGRKQYEGNFGYWCAEGEGTYYFAKGEGLQGRFTGGLPDQKLMRLSYNDGTGRHAIIDYDYGIAIRATVYKKGKKIGALRQEALEGLSISQDKAKCILKD